MFFYSLILYYCNGQTCTSPVYNNSAGATIRGPCPSSQVIVPVGSTIRFTCYFTGNGYTQFWNVSGLIFLTNYDNPPNTNVTYVINGGGSSGSTILTVPVESQYLSQLLDITFGLCPLSCTPTNLQGNFSTIPVHLIAFGKKIFTFINKMYSNSVGPPHLLTHQLLDNAVILRWSPPLMDYIQFQYNITVVNSDNISVLLTTVTNSTNITLHKDNISYIECSQLQWSVSAGTQYGNSKQAIAENSFIIVSGNISIIL